MTAGQPPRVRSYVRRQGRLTDGQRQALEGLWGRYGVDLPAGLLDLDAVFGRRAPRILEIGFGNGDSLAAMAQARPEADFLGIEVYRPGIGHLLLRARALELANLRVIGADAAEVVERHLAPASLERIQIFFPDPWPKKRHRKRRLIQPGFAALLAEKLKSGGQLHLASDWEEYARAMLETLNGVAALANAAGDGFAPRPDYRPPTKYERRGETRGHAVRDLIFRRR